MIKCEATQQFTLGRFNELKNLKRKMQDKPETIFAGDTFECSQELAEYLTGKNDKGVNVIRIIEVIPKKETVKKAKKSSKK